jgi:hypothetical protein
VVVIAIMMVIVIVIRLGVSVPVVEIRDVGMRVGLGVVAMDVRMLSDGHRIVNVIVVRIVMAMRVIVLESFVRMRVLVTFRHVEHEADHHDRPCHDGVGAGGLS